MDSQADNRSSDLVSSNMTGRGTSPLSDRVIRENLTSGHGCMLGRRLAMNCCGGTYFIVTCQSYCVCFIPQCTGPPFTPITSFTEQERSKEKSRVGLSGTAHRFPKDAARGKEMCHSFCISSAPAGFDCPEPDRRKTTSAVLALRGGAQLLIQFTTVCTHWVNVTAHGGDKTTWTLTLILIFTSSPDHFSPTLLLKDQTCTVCSRPCRHGSLCMKTEHLQEWERRD